MSYPFKIIIEAKSKDEITVQFNDKKGKGKKKKYNYFSFLSEMEVIDKPDFSTGVMLHKSGRCRMKILLWEDAEHYEDLQIPKEEKK